MFSITTPIYYVNDEPHLGHAYTNVLADVLARYHRLRGEEVFFLTGVDEHGQKVDQAVRRQGIVDPFAYVDEMAARFQRVWQRLNISHDDFIRTTQPRHVQVVQAVLQDLWERDEIYRGEYTGWYCVSDERFWTEKDLREGACPDCGRAVERIVEPNYFFRMGKYQSALVEHLQTHPNCIQPAYRRNEVLGFLRQPLEDLCIARPRSRLAWGIPLPFDNQYVTYVWFDALLNYVTAAGFLTDPDRFNRQWPHTVHLIGKDILTTHSVYWTTMLMAMGYPLPKTIFAHGWWTVEGQKMGKSVGNALRPLELVDVYGVDAFRYFLVSEMVPGADADFRIERLAARYTVDLANTYGNLLQRVTSMACRYLDCVLVPAAGGEQEGVLRARVEPLPDTVFARIENFQVSQALEAVLAGLAETNRYLEICSPWTAAKAGQIERVNTILVHAAEALRLCSWLLLPVLPDAAQEALRRLGCADCVDALKWNTARRFSITSGEPLFPKIA